MFEALVRGAVKDRGVLEVLLSGLFLARVLNSLHLLPGTEIRSCRIGIFFGSPMVYYGIIC